MEKNIVYKLVKDDVQLVSDEIIGRKLNEREIALLKDKVAEKIHWYEAIEDAINETILS